MAATNNYVYDEEGRLVKDRQEEIDTIIWRVDGKVKEIRRILSSEKKNLTFDYNSFGQRTAKHVYDNQTGLLEKSTYYILDAQGQQLSMYEHTVDTAQVNYYLTERNIYGSSRLGVTRDTVNMYNPQLLPSYGVLGNRNYELNNHLGNVLTVINDHITPLDEDLDEEVDGYQVGIRNTYDYSPFGVHLDERTMEKTIEVCREVSNTTTVYAINDTFDTGGDWTATGVGTLSYPSGTLKRSMLRTSSPGEMSVHKMFTAGEGVHTVTFDIVQNDCGQWVYIFGGGANWEFTDMQVRIFDQYNTLVASSSYAGTGSFSLSFTPASPGSTYKIQFHIPFTENILSTSFAVDNVAVSYDEMDTDIVCETVPLGFRYGFNSMERDDEIKGTGNSYDFGARFHDPRLGRFLSLDAYANKFASQSPYVFAGNMPVWAIDHNGDSVLFYSKSGDYLGYSHDNQRYKGKNLLVIIDDNHVENFKNQYVLKRNAEYSSPQAREANVAGLEGMGTTYDVTQIAGFIRKYTELLGPDANNTRKSPVYFDENLGRLQEQQEWGAWLVISENPVVKGKMNWVTLDESTITTDEAPGYVFIPTIPDNGKSWLHIHTSTSKKSSFSGNDLETMRIKNKNSYYKDATFWVGQVQFSQRAPGKEFDLDYYYHDESSGATIPLDNSSFKNASRPKYDK